MFAEIANGEAALAEARKGLDLFRRVLLKAAVTGELTKEWREANRSAETGVDLLTRIQEVRLKRRLSQAAVAAPKRRDSIRPRRAGFASYRVGMDDIG